MCVFKVMCLCTMNVTWASKKKKGLYLQRYSWKSYFYQVIGHSHLGACSKKSSKIWVGALAHVKQIKELGRFGLDKNRGK